MSPLKNHKIQSILKQYKKIIKKNVERFNTSTYITDAELINLIEKSPECIFLEINLVLELYNQVLQIEIEANKILTIKEHCKAIEDLLERPTKMSEILKTLLNFVELILEKGKNQIAAVKSRI